MDVTEERPRHGSPEVEKLARVEPPTSPPPNCAICLGTCANKCFTDCCLHQFCFNCLLEWSKIKAECPLCKQAFKSIIYNIKSNSEYEEHVITNPEHENRDDEIVEPEEPFNFYLPNGPRPQRHFQFRTTLTLEQGGELAIQQLLLTHPLTNTLLMPSRFNRTPQQSIAFRRAIYHNNWWALGAPDITGRYRDCSPRFFRENPAQTHRIQPWLNRELSAIIDDYINIFVAQQSIMELITQVPIPSNHFRMNIFRFLRTYTDHFIHEFYNFVRSPLDMIGYDTNVRYTYIGPDDAPPVIYHSVSDDDSDVRVIDSPNDCIYVAPRTPEVIVIHSDNSDSDVIFRTPTPPVVVDLLDTSSEGEPSRNGETSTRETSPKMPIKLRLKLKRNSPKRKKRYTKRRRDTTSDSDSSSSSASSTSSSSTRSRSDRYPFSSSDSDESSSESAERDWTPVKSENRYTQPIVLKRKKPKSKSRNKYDIKKFILKKKSRKNSLEQKRSIKHEYSSSSSEKSYKIRKSSKKSKHKKSKKRDGERTKLKKRIRVDSDSESSESDKDCNYAIVDQCDSNIKTDNEENYVVQPSEQIKRELPTSIPLSSLTDLPFINYTRPKEENDVDDYDPDVAGPSSSKGLSSVIVNGNNMWYRRPDLEETSSSDSD